MLTAPSIQLDMQLARHVGGFRRWLQTHRSAVAVAGLLAFALPVTFCASALSVMRAPTAVDMTYLGLWWVLYGASLWCLLLIAGYGGERLTSRFGRYVRGGIWLLVACIAAAIPNLLTAGRESILVEQGVVHSALTGQLHAFSFSVIMALLYFAHLGRSRMHEQAAARLAAAQVAQRSSRLRIVQARLQEVQARVDPQLLFEMLEAVRRLYQRDAAQAERLLDELIVFLRTALPRLRTMSSSLLRELQLARAFVRLHALAGAGRLCMTIDVAPDVMHARFPPGVLLPLLDGAVGKDDGMCQLAATHSDIGCRLLLTVDAPASNASVARVEGLLTELYGASGRLEIERTTDAFNIVVTVPYELA